MIKDYFKRRFGFLLFLLLLILSRIFLWEMIRVSGDSMAPTYEDKQRLIGVNFSRISRFDVVTVKVPDKPGVLYLKRVIGLPGEKIEMIDDVLYVDGAIIQEAYTLDYQLEFYQNGLEEVYGGHKNYQEVAAGAANFTENFSVEVPKDEYFVMGDNRLVSLDSRSSQIGTVKKSELKKEIKLIFWPLARFQFIL